MRVPVVTPSAIGTGLIAAVMTLAVVAYLPGLDGPYVLDDDENISLNPAIALTTLSPANLRSALLSNESGPLGRPLAALSFAFNHYAAGGFDQSFPFKVTNLAIHLLNSVLVYLLVLSLLETPAMRDHPSHSQRYLLAAFVCATWALHPIQLTNVLYVVQRMNSMSASFVLFGLLTFLHGRQQLSGDTKRGFVFMATGIGAGTLLGLSAKENAALLPIFALLVEFILFRREECGEKMSRYLRIFYGIAVALPAALLLIYVVVHPEIISAAYVERRFTPWERLLTEARVLWFYVLLIALPIPSWLGLFHDDIPISTGLLAPATTAFAVAAILVVLGISIAMRRRHPVAAFSALWFLVGHGLESSVLGLELAYEHRNYVPSLGIIFGVAIGLHVVLGLGRSVRKGRILACAVIPLTLAFATWNRAYTWADMRSLAENTVFHHPHSPRANSFAARVQISHSGDYSKAIFYGLQGIRVAPDEAAFYIELRILLSVLAMEINASPMAATLQKVPGVQLQIDGLPAEIMIGSTGGRVTLAHAASSDETIRHLLSAEPITVHEIVALENLRVCVLNPPRACRDLSDQARDWLATASTNTRTSKTYRAILLSSLARLYAATNKLDHAYIAATEAEGLDRSHLWYSLQRIEYLVTAGKIQEARALFALTAPVFDTASKRDPKLQHTITTLREILTDTKP